MIKSCLRKIIPIVIAVILVFLITVSVGASSVKTGDIPNDTYVYWNSKSFAYSSRSVYNYKKVLTSKEIGFDYTSLTDVVTDEKNNLYFLDSEASTVFILDKNYNYISSFTAPSEDLDFTGAQGMEYKNGKIYICDTSNARVLVFDVSGNLLSTMTLPESNLIPDDFLYNPIKIGVDSSGYVYVLSEGSYYGAILYSPDGEFIGFYGSNTVETGIMTALETIWEKLTMTNEKRANSERKLPYQFADLFVDKNDFVYTATGRTTNEKIEKGQIKRLNPGGTNVLKSNDVVFSDRVKSKVRFRTAGWTVDANVCIIIADSQGYMYCVDREASKIFIFDSDCNYISVLGGGNGDVDQVTAFKKISAIALNGDELIVLDEKKNNIVVMDKTEYGKNVFAAQYSVLNGDYSEALPIWKKVIATDKNNQLAYSGLAKGYLADKDYEKALEYAKEGKDYDTFDQTKTYIRNSYLKKNFNILAVCVLSFVGLVIAVVIILKKKNICLRLPASVTNALSVLSSPVDTFRSVKEKNTGSVAVATVLMLLCYLSAAFKNELSGFQFIGDSSGTYNSALTLLKTIGAVLLFTVSNWAVATLMQGRGTLKEIYIVTCYSLLPLIISNLVYTVLSNCLSLNEGAFLSIINVILIIYAAFIFVLGLITVHDVSFGRFFGITLLSVFGILVVIFIGVIVFMLAQQLFAFVMTVVNELIYR